MVARCHSVFVWMLLIAPLETLVHTNKHTQLIVSFLLYSAPTQGRTHTHQTFSIAKCNVSFYSRDLMSAR